MRNKKILLSKHFGSVRFVYNFYLNKRKEEYSENKKSLSLYDNCKVMNRD